ncbi:MAG TPA: hypothetical protein VEA77_06105, partial [Hyphomicrobium sp.]|nr:hypothetical protein [Hyphomicrobium sp.]
MRRRRGKLSGGISPAAFAGRLSTLLLAVVCGLLALSRPALALKAIEIGSDQGKVEITMLGDLYEARGDSLQVETAAGADGL